MYTCAVYVALGAAVNSDSKDSIDTIRVLMRFFENSMRPAMFNLKCIAYLELSTGAPATGSASASAARLSISAPRGPEPEPEHSGWQESIVLHEPEDTFSLAPVYVPLRYVVSHTPIHH